MFNKKISIDVHNLKEAEYIEKALSYKDVKAFAIIVGALSRFDHKTKKNIMDFIIKHFQIKSEKND